MECPDEGVSVACGLGLRWTVHTKSTNNRQNPGRSLTAALHACSHVAAGRNQHCPHSSLVGGLLGAHGGRRKRAERATRSAESGDEMGFDS